MDCREIIKLISDYIDRELEQVKREILEEHIKVCERCKTILNTTEKTIFLSKKIYKNKKVPRKIEKILYYQIRIRYRK
ncbi:MAG: zf-HC2 domain-containing protein [Candidatus Omnitrophica bacterium]|nr:zf-HC2 domain-containing protein [Candidatus Omnitrophota bacterium]MCM8832880.1 zf-HC2 domain-containing protein [Candidatus Omnitrophota bacterium]